MTMTPMRGPERALLDPTVVTSVQLPPRRSRLRGIPLEYLWCEIRRPVRRSNLIFNLALPAVLYLALFHTGPSGVELPGGNFAMWMMIGIAVYGSAAASTSAAASIAVEKSSGWMRTMRLTPLSTGSYVATKIAAAMVMAVLPVAMAGLLGLLTGARGTAMAWICGLGAAWAASAIFSALGLAIGLALRTEVVIHVPGLVITALAFLGNLFIPLSGTVLTIGRFTPIYGAATIARWGLTGGSTFGADRDSLGWAAVNALCWLAGFAIWAARRFTRSTGRV